MTDSELLDECRKALNLIPRRSLRRVSGHFPDTYALAAALDERLDRGERPEPGPLPAIIPGRPHYKFEDGAWRDPLGRQAPPGVAKALSAMRAIRERKAGETPPEDPDHLLGGGEAVGDAEEVVEEAPSSAGIQQPEGN